MFEYIISRVKFSSLHVKAPATRETAGKIIINKLQLVMTGKRHAPEIKRHEIVSPGLVSENTAE